MKKCTKCKEIKEYSEFYKDKRAKSGLQSECKKCHSARTKIYREKNSEHYKEYHKNYYKENMENHKCNSREYHLKSKFGITLDDYNEMLYNQDGKCKICEIHHTELKKALDVDHCHETSRVRGLLCNNCNRGIGHLKESIKNLDRAKKYLLEYTNGN